MTRLVAFLALLLMVLLWIGKCLSSQVREQDLSFIVNLEKDQFLPMEPIIATCSLDNRSSQVVGIPRPFGTNLRFEITLPNGSKWVGGYGPSGDETPNHPLRIWLESLRVFRQQLNLLDAVGFEQAGRYTVSISLDTTSYKQREPTDFFVGKVTAAPMPFQIVSPIGVDIEALRVIKNYVESRHISTLYLWGGNHLNLYQRLIDDFPNSTYTKYARFYLAEHYRTWYGERLGRQDYIEKAMEHYRKVLTDYPKFVLSGQAQGGIARCYFLRKDYAAAQREAEKVIKDYPDSFAAQEAKKLKDDIGKKQGRIEEANTSPGKYTANGHKVSFSTT